jgi:hypothetical protein
LPNTLSALQARLVCSISFLISSLAASRALAFFQLGQSARVIPLFAKDLRAIEAGDDPRFGRLA